MEKTTKRSILNPIEVCKYMPNTVKLFVGEPGENNYFLIDNDQGLINYLTQNAFKWTFDSNSNKDYGLLSASNEECKEIYGKTTIRLHQLVVQYYFVDTEEFQEYKNQKYVRGKKSKLVIEHLNNNERDNRIQNLHITTQQINKNKSIIDEMIDFNKCFIYYPTNDQGQKEYNKREYIIQFTARPGTFFKFNGTDQKCNVFLLSFTADRFKEYLETMEKISTLTKYFLDKNEEAQKIRKLVKEVDHEERRLTFSNLLDHKTSSVKELEEERTKNIQEIVNNLYSKADYSKNISSFFCMPVVDINCGSVNRIFIKDIEKEIVKTFPVDPGSINNETIENYIKEINFADYIK